MKKVVSFIAVALIAFCTSVSAQKVAHISLNDLLLLMPERKKAEADIQEYAKQLDSQLKSMSAEYEAKVGDYQAKEAMMTEPIKMDKQKEIAGLEDRIKEFQQTAQESLQKKQNELLEPMVNKAKKAVEDVAKELGYKNVIDSSVGVLLYSDPADDIMAQVKKKMGITDVPAPSPTPAPKK